MEVAEVMARVQAALSGAEVKVDGKDCDFTLTVIYDEFANLNRIKRSQQVLGCFTEELASGAIHALSVKAFTTDEWQASQQNALTQLIPT